MKTGKLTGLATMWEIEYLIKSAAMEKTILLMAPSDAKGGLRDGGATLKQCSKMGEYWDSVRAQINQIILDLPPYSEGGAVMTFSKQDNGSWKVEDMRKSLASHDVNFFGFSFENTMRSAFADALLEIVQNLCIKRGIQLLDR